MIASHNYRHSYQQRVIIGVFFHRIGCPWSTLTKTPRPSMPQHHCTGGGDQSESYFLS